MLLALFCGFFVNLIKKSLTTRFGENQKELIERIRRGKYTPDPVRRVEIPKPDGGIRKLGIPTV
ncbi:hypothetical protein, partial [[Clostridium] symbiosum]|uniref:hypothetical protein n=1 Tax=Clostridium symbiosum TaxID=1512 RepID=UPI001A9AFA67